jgi:hypothetical protein
VWQGWRESLWVCVDCRGMGAVKRETNVNPNLAEFYWSARCFCVYTMLFFYAHNIGERDEQSISKVELVLFRLKRNVSTNNRHVKSYLYRYFKLAFICSFLVQSKTCNILIFVFSCLWHIKILSRNYRSRASIVYFQQSLQKW